MSRWTVLLCLRQLVSHVNHAQRISTIANKIIVAPPATFAKQAASPTSAPARVFQSPTPGAAPRRMARQTRKPAASTTGTARRISSGPGTRPTSFCASTRTSWRRRSWAVLWPGVWVRILGSLRIWMPCSRGLSRLPSSLLRRSRMRVRGKVRWRGIVMG